MTTLHKRRFGAGFRGGAFALALAAFALTACEVPGGTTGQDQATPGPAATQTDPGEPEDFDIQVGDLTGNLEDYVGQEVSVRGEAVESIGENAFLVRDDQLFGGQEVVVFNATGAPLILPRGGATERLQVTGQVREVVIEDLAQEYGLTLDEETYGNYENSPAIIAESVALAPEPGEISDNPEAFYDQPIAVEGAVGEQYEQGTFTITQDQLFGGADVLVVGATPGTGDLRGAEEVVITGVLRPYVAADFERDYNLTWDEGLQQTIEAEYSEKPVLVAEQIYPLVR
ncbi:hypothetical protein [Pseudanabaena sp. FACHB-2040]|uniref:hypothetical protein n=1 Tax=Pseudanabaena sp. FACHB-2040 TaxID=2692859 RepID=UPI00168450FF|nr:hypothetical protein [Pseudanabaena sp. FACHB-2040]MBD2256827.1 hypothetical protein [Pseudanabaena sp. FACHB-2040]